MTAPLVWPRPGTRGDVLQGALERAFNEAAGLTASGPALLPAYLAWATDATRRLQPHLHPEDLDRLIRTRMFWAAPGLNAHAEATIPLVNQELSARREELGHAAQSIEAFRWRLRLDRPTTYVVADTNVALEHPGGLAGVDWPTVLDRYMRPFDDVRVILPLGVVDELDNLKRVTRTKDSARHALKAIYRHFGTAITSRQAIRPGDVDDGQVFVELLMEPPAHVRMPRMDDELILVAVRLSAFTPSPPVFLTYDTGAAFRAAAAGLPHVRLVHNDDKR